MDYSNIIPTANVDEKSPVSRSVCNFYAPKPDTKEMLLEIEDEIEKAKAFLCTPSPALNVTLFDHLVAVLAKVVREKADNAVDVIESISLSVKSDRYSETSAKTILVEKAEPNEKLLKYIKSVQVLFKNAAECKDINLDIKPPEDDEDEPPEEEDIQDDDLPEENAENLGKEEEYNLRNVLPDLCYHMHYFREAGVGLSCNEVLRINISLKTLAFNLKLDSLRFWGKIFGLHCDYYIAETPFKEGIEQEEFGWRSTVKHSVVVKPESELEDETAPEEETEATDVNNEEETEEPKMKYVVIPPEPTLKPPSFDFAPADENMTGVNKNLYFVCTEPGSPWFCLPQCLPEQIIAARQTKKFLSGKLSEEVRGYPLFPGKEAHYLRAQIARISACTNICPKDYYQISSVPDAIKGEDQGADEDDVSTREEVPEEISDIIQINADYQALSVNEMFKKGLEQWVHGEPAVLQEGCSCLISSIKTNATEENNEVNASQEEQLMDTAGQECEIEEKHIQSLRCISQDKVGGGLLPWTLTLPSNLMAEQTVLLLMSNVWPGAYTYYSGKSFENIYIGTGQKYSTRHYAPALPVTHPKEYPHGPDITEHDYSMAPCEEANPLEESLEGQEESDSHQ